MRDTLHFLLGNAPRRLRDVSPTLTVLDYLRNIEHLCGTKEGCAEGDCGACTVVLRELDGEHMRTRAVNACILFVPALDRKQLLTVEHLRQPDGALHPVQQAMVEQHASQCGFCTLGFVMSLVALQRTDVAPDRQAVNEALAGNLCRCTGYRAIVDAGLQACAAPPADAAPSDTAPTDTASDAATLVRLRGLDTATPLALQHEDQRYFAPRTLAAVAALLMRHPDAQLVAGGTDVGLMVTKQHRRLPLLIALDAVPELARISQVGDTLRIGAAATYEDALAALEPWFPDFGVLLRRLGSRQIRNRGTIGGNIGNASPIGDTPPALIALKATLVLRRGTERRVMPLEDCFAGFRQTGLSPGEFIEHIEVPLPSPGMQFRCYKVAKRFDQDISAVCGAFNLHIADGRVQDVRIGFGGIAATPARARNTEQTLLGQPWSGATVQEAMAALDAEFAPISDMRASAAYRRMVARNLLYKAFLETSGATAQRTRLTVAT